MTTVIAAFELMVDGTAFPGVGFVAGLEAKAGVALVGVYAEAVNAGPTKRNSAAITAAIDAREIFLSLG